MSENDILEAMLQFARQESKRTKTSFLVFASVKETRMFVALRGRIEDIEVPDDKFQMNRLSLSFFEPDSVSVVWTFVGKSKLMASYRIVGRDERYIMILDQNGNFLVT